MRFTDRRDAGRRLAERLTPLRAETPVVVGLPRGGVPVAAEVAARLQAPLDVLIVRKLGCPWQPELGMGAIGEGGARVLNHDLIARLGVTAAELDVVAAREQAELARRVRAYRGTTTRVPAAGRVVIVVDDGIATGFTARAAITVLRQQGAQRVVLAVPVAPPETVEELRGVADDVVCLQTPAWFSGIGAFYTDFTQTSDAEVRRLLAQARQEGTVVGAAASADPDDSDPARDVEVAGDGVRLPGNLGMPEDPIAAVIFAHGSGSSRLSPRNTMVAGRLNGAGLATLLFDLLTPTEALDRANVFDTSLLADRLVQATRWLRRQPEIGELPLGYFGASTGAAAALRAAAALGDGIAAVVSRGGRPDLAGPSLARVTAPTLLIVGGRDEMVLELNRHAQQRMRCTSRLEVVPDAGHLFEEPGALDTVADLAAQWFAAHR
ncbi:MAG TPA: phosphoribosyltransferase family protein [Euzebyales bacterium]